MKRLLSTLLIFSTVFSTVACTTAFAKETVTTSAVQTTEVNTNNNIANTESTETNVPTESTEEENNPSIISRIAKGLGWGTVCASSFLFSSFVRTNLDLVLTPLISEVIGLVSMGMVGHSLLG